MLPVDDAVAMNMDDPRRARSFGLASGTYEQFRPGPPIQAIEWVLDDDADVVVDLGAGTGALSRRLIQLGRRVIAVEPDAAMRDEFRLHVSEADLRDGTGEALPLESASVDAIVASTSWHWVDPLAGLTEAARVLRPGGTMAALWTGVDPESAFMQQARGVLVERGDGGAGLATIVAEDPDPDRHTLHIPAGQPFDAPDHKQFRFSQDLTADELIGLLSTMSWVILLDEPHRQAMFATARQLLHDVLGVHGEVTVTLEFTCDVYRSRRLPRSKR